MANYFVTKHNPQKVYTSLLLIVLVIFPFVAANFGNSRVRIMDFALLYIMLALGLNIVVGFAGLLDLGYIAFYALGAYMSGLLASPLLIMLNRPAGLWPSPKYEDRPDHDKNNPPNAVERQIRRQYGG